MVKLQYGKKKCNIKTISAEKGKYNIKYNIKLIKFGFALGCMFDNFFQLAGNKKIHSRM